MNEATYFPDARTITIITLAWLAFAGTRILLRLLRNTGDQNRNRFVILDRVSPYLEMISVVALLLWSFWLLFGSYPLYFTIAVITIVFVLLWSLRFALVDIIAGVVLRSENRYHSGEFISIDGVDSEICEVGYRSLTTKINDGLNQKIPYSILSTKTLAKPTATSDIAGASFNILLPATMKPSEALDSLKMLVMTSPWSIPARLPDIKLVERSAEGFQVQITVYALETRHLTELKNSIGEAFEVIGNRSSADTVVPLS